MFQFAQLVREIMQLGKAEFRFVHHGALRVEFRVLHQIPDLRVPRLTATTPTSGCTWPLSILKSVDFPVPLSPMNPTRSPSKIAISAFSKRTFLPKCFSTLLSDAIAICVQHQNPARPASQTREVTGKAMDGFSLAVGSKPMESRNGRWASTECFAIRAEVNRQAPPTIAWAMQGWHNAGGEAIRNILIQHSYAGMPVAPAVPRAQVLKPALMANIGLAGTTVGHSLREPRTEPDWPAEP